MTNNNFLVNQNKNPLSGKIEIPGDKSCSHRSLMLASLMNGNTEITGLLEAEDVLATKDSLISLGVSIEKKAGKYNIKGCGYKSLVTPEKILDLQNSGTGVRLLIGLLSTMNITANFTGDQSLNKRPMARVLQPLSKFGFSYNAREGNFLPLFLKGNKDAVAIKHEIEVASAQVKSALLLGAINAHGESEIIEPVLTRDHTEIMMQYLGFNLTEKLLDGKKHIYLNVEQELKAKSINIAGDPSSAAFLASLAILTKGSDIVIKNILFNVHRTGFFEVAKNMGADITIINDKILSGERVVDLRIKYSTLTGVITEKEIAPKTIDEYPILAILAAKAEGKTRFNGLEELKVKESNRFSAIIDNLKNCGVKVEYGNDWIEIEGCKNFKISEVIKTHHDHRIAMSFIILGLTITEQVTIDDTAMIKTSFPEFFDKLKELNANI